MKIITLSYVVRNGSPQFSYTPVIEKPLNEIANIKFDFMSLNQNRFKIRKRSNLPPYRSVSGVKF